MCFSAFLSIFSFKQCPLFPHQARQQKREENKQRKQLELAEKARQRVAVQQERDQKKREAAHAKALKQAAAEVERAKKPGECLKVFTIKKTNFQFRKYVLFFLDCYSFPSVDY